MLWGEICWTDLNPVRGCEQAGLRPVLILSHDVFNERSETVIAGVLTSGKSSPIPAAPISRALRQRSTGWCMSCTR
ncbi:MAG: type II toxin-antitoxin system PemK/MazF family toxin [Nitrospirales bacterium]|nr:type II toxin-antitoxin system PemK/MazF family toxin [Nitrospirales bacterium]